MTISTTTDRTTQQGNGVNTTWNYSFLIPSADDVVVTVTTIADSSTEVISSSAYTITGIGEDAGGIVTYPTSGSPLSTAYNLTIQRVLPETQETDLVNQSGFYPDVVESALDYLTMICQQLQGDLNQCLAFPVGSLSDEEAIDDLMAAILNGQANATAAAASAASAASSLATLLAQLPVDASNIQTGAVTTAKIASNAVTAVKLDGSAFSYADGMVNGTLVASVAANALTVAIKTKAGTDPSATDPVYVIFRSTTQATGDYTVITLTAATSFVVSSGSTLGSTSAQAFRLWVVGFNDSGVFRLGLINCATSTQVFPLNESIVASSTAEGGAGAADSAGVFYTGTAVSSKGFRVLGHLDFSAGQATAGTWATAADVIQLFGPGIPLPGTPIQHVHSTSAGVGTTTSATFAALGGSPPSVSITPKSACNRCLITWGGAIGNSGGSATMGLQLARGATQLNTEINVTTVGATGLGISSSYMDIFLNGSSVSYGFFGKTASGTLQWAGTNSYVNMHATEIQV